tara:strand:- start:1158 stop:1322 length:165 start_codon:yes stop_codon:yes gene_type:complete
MMVIPLVYQLKEHFSVFQHAFLHDASTLAHFHVPVDCGKITRAFPFYLGTNDLG